MTSTLLQQPSTGFRRKPHCFCAILTIALYSLVPSSQAHSSAMGRSPVENMMGQMIFSQLAPQTARAQAAVVAHLF